jgi:nonribosomal peptide synthetase protein VioO
LDNSGVVPVLDVVDAFREVVDRYPARQAIIHNGRSLTYAGLSARVQATALRLGQRPGVVGVFATHSPDTVIRLLGVLAAGGSYCPIDPAFPAIRQREMLAAADCRVVLAADRELSSPTSGPTRTECATEPEDPAYTLFTSGSTGTPKLVVTPRRAIASAVASLHDLFGLTPADRVLQFASLNWDTCFEEILPTLTTGASLVFNDEAHSGSFPRILRMIENERITVLDLPTAFWHELVGYLVEYRAALPGCVRVMVIGGEPVSPARLADWCDLETARIRLVNTYGCTETTLVTHAVDLHGPQAARFDSPWWTTVRVPIGWALPHVREHLSEERELLIGGPSLALGYRGRPEETEARFVTLDIGAGAETYFRTGDRVTRSVDGMLVHQGRIDGEIKVRGIRVDPAETEAHVAGHPDVGAVAVTGATIAGRTTLVAYVVPRHSTADGALGVDVLAHLRTRVPAHLVPSHVTVVSELVYTPSGKVDRAGTHRRHSAPRPIEEQSMIVDDVVAIFRRVLETTEVTADSDFFALGGDSLVATRVLSAVARDFGAELSFEDFAMVPTPAAVAKKIAGSAP